MPKIDPLQLLNCLKILLSENGGIGSSKDVGRVAGLMNKYSKKLVSKCIYIQILKCTNTDLLEVFMGSSGWDLVYSWLVDAISKNNWILVQEVLELFLLCPVDTTRLKSNSAPKVVKNLSISGGTSVVKHLATKLVDQWLYIVKSQTPSIQTAKAQEPVQEPEAPATSPIKKILLKDGNEVLAKISVEDSGSKSPSIESEKDEVDDSISKEKKESSEKSSSSKSSSSSSKSRHKSSSSSSSSSKKSSSSSSSSSSRHHSKDKSSSSSSSSKDKDRHRSSSSSKSSSRDKDRDKERHRSKDKSSSSSSSSSKDKSREKSEKEKSSLSLSSSSSERDKILEKLAKITKKSKEEDSPTSITVPSKKASISIEIKKDAEKSSAVKTYKSQFRSHGLTEEAPPPPSRKGLKKPVTQPAVIPPPVQPTSLKRPSPPPKDSPTEKRAKIDIIAASPTSVPEKVGGVKLIAPKPKPSALVETNLFSDALSASMAPKKASKRKLKAKEAAAEPESPQKLVAPLKFYQDTLDEKKEDAKNDLASPKTEESKDETEDEDDIPLKKVKEDIKKKEEEAKEATPPASPTQKPEDEVEEIEEILVKPPGPGCGPDGPPGVLTIHRRKGPKKKLTWKPEAELEQIRYFESDENERVNVTKTSFMDMKQLERCSERDAMIMGKKFNPNDNQIEQIAWVKPYEIDGEIPVHPMGSGSKEKIIQQEREKNTLKTIYFSVGMIPDSPAEADFEHVVSSDPVVIPIDDVAGNPDTVNDFTGMAWPEAKIGGGGEELVSTTINENPFKPINPFNSNAFMPFAQNENTWMNNGPPPMGMPPIGPPMNMHGPPMNMNGPPMRPPQFFNGPPNGPGPFGPPPHNFGPPGPHPNMMNMNGGPPPINFNNGPPPRDFGNNNNRRVGNDRRDDNRGGWRPGNPNNNDNWRNGPPAGPGDNRGPPRGNPMNNRPPPPQNWVQGGNNNMNMNKNNNVNGVRGVCKQYLRGNCRNNRCNFIHPKKF